MRKAGLIFGFPLSEGQPSPDESAVRFGRIDRDRILQEEIAHATNAYQIYQKTKGLDRSRVSELAEIAIEAQNLPALLGLARRNKYAVVEILERSETASEFLVNQSERENWELLDLYYMVKDNLPDAFKRFFLSMTCKVIVRSALRVAGRGIRKDLIRIAEYAPGTEEFDLDQTLENLLEYGVLGTRDIVALERLERKKAGMLILDVSGSMYREKLAMAAVTVAVLAYSMKYDDYSVVLFESDAKLLKPFTKTVPIEEMVETIFGLRPSGYTNIEAALRKAYEEMTRIRRKDKWAVLVTDGDYNQGGDPRHFAQPFRRLNVIRVGRIKKGEDVCKDLARLGHGKYESVSGYRNLPLALLRIMR